MSRWFYACDKKKCGPLTSAELKARVDAGQIKMTDMVLREGEQRWTSASSVVEFLRKATVKSPPSDGKWPSNAPGTACPKCGNETSILSRDLLSGLCPDCYGKESNPGTPGTLVPCSDCKKEISSKALACPSCGAPNSKGKQQPSGINRGAQTLQALGFFAIIFVVFLAWRFNLFDKVKTASLPTIEVGQEFTKMGISFTDWRWDGLSTIKGKIVNNTPFSPLAANSIACIIYGKNKIKINDLLLIFPAVNPGQIAECYIVVSRFDGVERIFIGVIDPQLFPPGVLKQ